MKFIRILILSMIIGLTISGCGNKEYIGFWCNYEETATIIITLKDDNTEKQRKEIENIITNFSGLSSFEYIPRDAFIEEGGGEGNAHDQYIIYFLDKDTIDESAMALENLNGVDKVEKDTVKTNVSLYEIVNRKNYKFQDGLGVDDEYKVTGKYKIKDNTINLQSATKSTTLYIKNNYLCADQECNKIYSKTDANCEIIK